MRIQTGEAAALLGVSPRMVQKLMATGKLAGIKVGAIWGHSSVKTTEVYLAWLRK